MIITMSAVLSIIMTNIMIVAMAVIMITVSLTMVLNTFRVVSMIMITIISHSEFGHDYD